MELHDEGTDRLLTALGVKPEGTPTPSPRAYAWRLRGCHHAYCEGQEIGIIGASTHAECRRELARRQREGFTNLQIMPDLREWNPGRDTPAPLAILGPGGDYTREIR